jgi:tRNA(Ile)-lysidine synthase
MNLEPLLRASWPPNEWHELTVLVAVSGGADSVALLRALHAVRVAGPGRLIVAHFNHAEADGDEAFVVDLARLLDLNCLVGRSRRPEGASLPLTRIEERARHERYEFLHERAAHVGARYVATAHTADDQAETVLHRIVRGTGVAGLAGMRRVRPLCEGVALIRPLLGVRRAELATYLQSVGQSFREDATNAERRFTRNRLRHELLPQLAGQYNVNVVDALLRLSQLAGEVQQVIDSRMADLIRRTVAFEASRATFDPTQLVAEPRYLVRELFMAAWRRQGWPEQAMGFAEWDSLADDLLLPKTKTDTRRTLPGGIAVVRRSDALVLERR